MWWLAIKDVNVDEMRQMGHLHLPVADGGSPTSAPSSLMTILSARARYKKATATVVPRGSLCRKQRKQQKSK